jgi:nucleoside 2-deoxyribosyltransferase
MRVFVSSAISDLLEFRAAAARGIASAGHEPVSGDDIFPTAGTVTEAVVHAIAGADALVVIIGTRLGSLEPTSGRPWTLFEVGVATATNKPIFIYIVQPTSHEDSEQSRVLWHFAGNLTSALKEENTPYVKRVRSPEELALFISQDLRAYVRTANPANDTRIFVSTGIDPKEIATLLANPEELRACSSRFFESLVAELLAADGWDVQLVARNNAPGPDIIAVTTRIVQTSR